MRAAEAYERERLQQLRGRAEALAARSMLPDERADDRQGPR